MKFNNLTNTFTSGEWSPKMRARTDAAEYLKACEKLINFLPKIQGGAFRRPGTVRVILDSDGETDLQGAYNPVFIKSKMIPKTLSNGTKQVLVAFDTQPSTTWFAIDAVDPQGSNVVLGTVSAGADFSSDAANIKYVQIGDIVIICEQNFGPGKPVRVWDSNTYTAGNLRLFSEQVPASFAYKTVPYRDIQALGSSVTITTSGTTGNITLTASAAFFDPGHVGSFFKFSSAGTTGVVKVTGYTSSTVVSATVISAVAATAHGASATTSWEESAWSDYRGWPRTVTTYQGRLIFGGNSSQPESIWGTRIGNVFDLMERPFEQDPDFTGYRNDNSRPFTLTPNTGASGNIRALSAAKSLTILTDRAEIVGFGVQGALGPNDVSFESSTSFGANSPMVARTNNYMVFVQRGGKKLRDVIFNFNEDQYKSNDLGFVADHLLFDDESNQPDSIIEIIGSEIDSSYLWAKTATGRLLCLTLDRDYQVTAWSQVVIGGKSESKTYPLVKSVTAIPMEEGSGDRVFVIVARNINGSNKIFLEYFDTPYESKYIKDIAFNEPNFVYVDCKQTYFNNTEYTTVNTGTALIGETVQVVADGQYIGEKVIDGSGVIDLGVSAKHTVWGYKFPSEIRTLPIEIGAQIPGTPQGLVKRIDEISLKFFATRGCKYGTRDAELLDIDFKNTNLAMDQYPEFFTGIKTLKVASNYERESQVILKTETPWPCNVLCIISKGVLYD
jgi:hypothetical protein